MKRFFIITTCVLSLASALLYWTAPGKEGKRPVIYWITQDDENKQAIVTAFHEWLAAEGHPDVDLRIDNTNQDPTKKLVQGVSGVGADIFDLYGHELDLFQATGMLRDLTEEGKRLGFSPEATYPGLRNDLVMGGRQFAFPRNAGVNLFIVNLATFRQHGVPPPPARWTPDEFEALGKKFVAAANPPGARQRVYFTNIVSRDVLRRGMGLANYNETGTRCMLDDPRNVEVLRRMRQWVVEDRLFPSKEEDAAMAADITGPGSMFSHFTSGRFGMIFVGEWAFIMLRPRGRFELNAVEPPTDGFPNSELGGGGIGVYKNTKHPTEAVQFMQFLASDQFSRVIVRISDSLPPVPYWSTTDEVLRPVGKENEWPVHQAYAKAINEIGVLVSKSPFVLQTIMFRSDVEIYEAVIAGRFTPAEGAKVLADRINAEIANTVARDPKLRALYERRLEIQRQIDARRAAGQRVPAEWVTDSFHAAYYKAHGWLEEAKP